MGLAANVTVAPVLNLHTQERKFPLDELYLVTPDQLFTCGKCYIGKTSRALKPGLQNIAAQSDVKTETLQ